MENANTEQKIETDLNEKKEVNGYKWNLKFFDPIQKSPIEAPSSLEPVGSNAKEEIEDDEDGELNRTPSDDYPNTKSNSTIGENDKSDEEDHSMPPPSRVRSTPDSLQRTPDTTILNSALQILNDPNIIRPLSSISDSDDASKNISQKTKKKRPRKQRTTKNTTADITSSDESRERFSVEEKQITTVSRGRQQKKQMAVDVVALQEQTINAKHTKKSPKTKNRRNTQISRPVLSTDSSSDDDGTEVKKPPRKRQKSPEKQQIPDSTIQTSSDDDARVKNSHSLSRSPVEVPRNRNNLPSYHSDSESNHSGTETTVDRKKNNVLGKLFGSKSTSEGGKGGKGGKGAKGKGGQVVVITQEDVQNQSQKDTVQNHNPKFTSPSSAFNSSSSSMNSIPTNLSIRVSIPLIQIDLMRSGISDEKLKLAGYRPSKTVAKKHRKLSTDPWQKNLDHMSESDSSSEQMMENPATRPTSYTTPNYNNDRLNNNVDHKSKDLNNFYPTHSPISNVGDVKQPRIKAEATSKSDSRKEKLKQVMVKQEKQDEIESKPRDRSSSMNSNSNHSHSSYKERKRKRIDDNNSLLPPTNHERMQNGDLTPPTSTMLGSSVKPEVLKKVYVSYFERNDETDHEFR